MLFYNAIPIVAASFNLLDPVASRQSHGPKDDIRFRAFALMDAWLVGWVHANTCVW